MPFHPTRRALLQSLAAAPALAKAPVAAADLPPSIAALKSRAAEARPITPAERHQRIEQAQRLMRAQKIAAVCIAGGASMTYFAGLRWGNSERPLILVLPASGEPFFVLAAFEEGRARQQLAAAFPGEKLVVITWEEDDNPYDKVAAELKARGLATGSVGIEETMPFAFSDGIAKALPSSAVVSATPVTAGCRMIKSQHELDLLQLANEATLAAFAAAWREIRPGMSAGDISSLIASAHQQLGFRGYAMVLLNESSALPHGSSTPQVVRENSVVLLDGGCTAQGYESDISRTFVVGKPNDRMRSVFDIVHRAQAEALRAARPGVPCASVDRAARKVIEDAGYGPGYKYFTHRLGHGVGLEGHEWTYLRPGNPIPLEAGMCFSDEPGIYIPGEFGLRLEDCFHVTPDGARMFTPPSASLERPFDAP